MPSHHHGTADSQVPARSSDSGHRASWCRIIGRRRAAVDSNASGLGRASWSILSNVQGVR